MRYLEFSQDVTYINFIPINRTLRFQHPGSIVYLSCFFMKIGNHNRKTIAEPFFLKKIPFFFKSPPQTFLVCLCFGLHQEKVLKPKLLMYEQQVYLKQLVDRGFLSWLLQIIQQRTEKWISFLAHQNGEVDQFSCSPAV